MKLISFVKHWLQDIIMIFIIITLIEILLPNSNMRKYINMVVGFLIILVLISPFLKLLNQNYNIDDLISEIHIETSDYNLEDESELLSTQDEQIKELYINRFKSELEKLIYETSNYKVDYINIYINEEKFEELQQLEILVSEKEKEEDETKDSIVTVEIKDVSIKDINNEMDLHKEFLEWDAVELKKIIYQNFDIPKENIKIFLNSSKVGELDGKFGE
ncbi:stage III sporulation protein AF [Keratinibaculum paraultunense]|uniref:Stage III sporulation protein AF n=1 Tax=Keratinibaculum paraultunense TaxID=1278232 RepID=A0A4R3L2A3_9FIRM|nr:stage III sporulation protein AF [Keratinibaculum paraultunense]QQY80611.1 stage III sporulation protein AF [Keratinibaculum paraultunense]TCS91341.1 stage III sporulation protein AF [Keratinibaculum paraultunense]